MRAIILTMLFINVVCAQQVHFFDLVEVLKKDSAFIRGVEKLKKWKSSQEEKPSPGKTVEEIYHLLSKNTKREIHFAVAPQTPIAWAANPLRLKKDFATNGLFRIHPLDKKNTYGTFTLTKTCLQDVAIPWDTFMQFFQLYLEDIKKQRDNSAAPTKYSSVGKDFFARFAHDLPHTYNHFTRYVNVEDRLVTTNLDKVHLRFTPKNKAISHKYPQWGESLQKIAAIDIKFTLVSKENNETLAMWHWNKKNRALDFKCDLSQRLPSKMLLKIDLDFYRSGIGIQIEDFCIHLSFTHNSKHTYLGAKIKEVPKKIKMSGFWSFFFSPNDLTKFFETLTYMNNNRGSEIRIFHFGEKHNKYLQCEVYASLRGSARLGKKKASPKKKSLFRRDGMRAVVKDYQVYVNREG
ncbi:hypothetical protein [Candidatus Uabimicrobium amorphum]|uniref:Uncharacterized protein n=1 Tax=Uabimicrobium amorphum TaxID=2596890 RepID=A0A5S9IHG5_UABAM|nr:hypothetical protein [Candidatus Uabimicrobium amorphum]BBM81853.1 hypothetical protein UABAM_00194 [Candidatus Uabimicrobium amorphum]